MARVKLDSVPKNGIAIEHVQGKVIVSLYKDAQVETDSEGREVISARTQQLVFPDRPGLDIEEDVKVHFDAYWDKAEQIEVSKMVELRVSRVQSLLKATDYKLFKRSEGALSKAEYEPWKQLRQHWRDTVNKMQAAKTVEELNAIKYAETPEGLVDLEKAGLV